MQRTYLNEVHRLEQRHVHTQFQHQMNLQATQAQQEIVQKQYSVEQQQMQCRQAAQWKTQALQQQAQTNALASGPK